MIGKLWDDILGFAILFFELCFMIYTCSNRVPLKLKYIRFYFILSLNYNSLVLEYSKDSIQAIKYFYLSK